MRKKIQHKYSTLDTKTAQALLKAIHHYRHTARQKCHPPGRRKLDPYRHIIGALRAVGASERDIQTWLRIDCKLKVSRSTVHYYLKNFSIDEINQTQTSRLSQSQKKST